VGTDSPAAGSAWLVVGVGARRSTPACEILGLIEDTLRDAGLPVRQVVELATADAKAGEPGIVETAEHLGVPLRSYPADLLASVMVLSPSEASSAALGTPSVAEAAALAGGGELLVPKRKSGRDGRPGAATCAVVARDTQENAGMLRRSEGLRVPRLARDP
jgi:cobalamin biosynthesis protein CbiG